MCVLAAWLWPTLRDPIDGSASDPSVHGILQERLHEWVDTPFSRGSSQYRDRTWVSSIAGGFFMAEPPGKPYYTGVGSHSLLQGIFFTQGPNLGLPHCRKILYHLSQKADANNEASPTTLCPGGYYMLLPPLSPRVDLSLVFWLFTSRINHYSWWECSLSFIDVIKDKKVKNQQTGWYLR